MQPRSQAIAGLRILVTSLTPQSTGFVMERKIRWILASIVLRSPMLRERVYRKENLAGIWLGQPSCPTQMSPLESTREFRRCSLLIVLSVLVLAAPGPGVVRAEEMAQLPRLYILGNPIAPPYEVRSTESTLLINGRVAQLIPDPRISLPFLLRVRV
jgi:hypothetical protein